MCSGKGNEIGFFKRYPGYMFTVHAVVSFLFVHIKFTLTTKKASEVAAATTAMIYPFETLALNQSPLPLVIDLALHQWTSCFHYAGG